MKLAHLDQLAEGLAPVVVDEIAAALAPLLTRLAVLEARASILENHAPVTGPAGPVGPSGRDGAPGAPGRDGADGFGLEDFTATFDGERTVTCAFTRGELSKAFTFTIAALVYQGVYEEGRAYVKGDVVTWGGHAWIAKAATDGKPGVTASADRAWQLAVKAGRDGREGKPGPVGPTGPPGARGDAVRLSS